MTRRLVPSESATDLPDWSGPVVVDEHTDAEERVLSDERRTAVRDGLAELSDAHRALLAMLVAEPPISYQQISAKLGLPLGSNGPTRAWVLRKLAATVAMRRIVEAYAGAALTRCSPTSRGTKLLESDHSDLRHPVRHDRL